MRFKEFLIEYRRDLSAQRYGKKILRAFAAMPVQNWTNDLYAALQIQPNSWSNLRAAAAMTYNPGKYTDMDSNVQIEDNIEHLTKETAPAILQKYSGLIINGILNYFESKDPTPNKEYTQWLTRMWYTNPNLRFEDINRHNLLGVHKIAKNRRILKREHLNIDDFRSYKDFEKTMTDNYDIDEITRSAPITNKGTSQEMLNNSEMRIIWPQDMEASQYYGAGSIWCTAARNDNRFDSYNARGPLYIILPKKPKHVGEKYQLHFADDEFKNENDNGVSLTYLINRFPTLRDWILTVYPESKYYLEIVPDDRLVNYWRTGMDVLQPLFDDYFTEWEWNDDGYVQWKAKKAKKLGYVTPDGEVDWERVNDDDEINDYSDYSSEYDDALKKVESIRNWPASYIRDEIDQTLQFIESNRGEFYIPKISSLDTVFEHLFYRVLLQYGGTKVQDTIRDDLIINPISKWGTNRPIISKETTDGYVFALAAPERNRRR